MKAGCILLSVWSGLNLLVGAGVTMILMLGRNAPALAYNFSTDEIAQLDPKAVATVNGLAHLANPLIAALCCMVLFVIWNGVAKQARWAWWSLVVTLLPVQVFGFDSDKFFGNQNIIANAVSAGVLFLGLVLTYPGARTNVAR